MILWSLQKRGWTMCTESHKDYRGQRFSNCIMEKCTMSSLECKAQTHIHIQTYGGTGSEDTQL